MEEGTAVKSPNWLQTGHIKKDGDNKKKKYERCTNNQQMIILNIWKYHNISSLT